MDVVSPVFSSTLSDAVEVRRNVGRFGSPLPGSALRRLCMDSRRAFTSSNSDVVTICSSRAGSTVAISFCVALIRSGVCGCDANIFDSVPGLRFSLAWIFSKKVTKACGS